MSTSPLYASLRHIRYKWSPRQTFADLFAKTWMEPAIPFTLLFLLVVGFALSIPYYATIGNAETIGRSIAEFDFVAIAMGLSLISGGIDLSVGSVFAMADFVALAAFNFGHLPIPVVALSTLIAGGLLGAVNGFFIGILRTRAFLTTLGPLILYRGIFDLLTLAYSGPLAMANARRPA